MKWWNKLVKKLKTEAICKNCKYYDDVWDTFGHCQFMPPVLRKEQRYQGQYTGNINKDLIEEVLHKEYPGVPDWYTCGQFKRKVEDC